VGAFEHVILLLSFVYALAIAHLLTTVAGLVRGWERVRFSWPHALQPAARMRSRTPGPRE
jgi:hypothetical protein